jgi:hypothetical protein
MGFGGLPRETVPAMLLDYGKPQILLPTLLLADYSNYTDYILYTIHTVYCMVYTTCYLLLLLLLLLLLYTM